MMMNFRKMKVLVFYKKINDFCLGSHSHFSLDSSYDPFELSSVEQQMIERAMEQSIETSIESLVPIDSER